jgi:hypothetical protein
MKTPPESITPVTQAFFVKLTDQAITLPISFSKKLYEELQAPQVLMVCLPSTKTIRYIPTTGNTVLNLIIFFKPDNGGVTENYLTDIGQIFIEWQIKTLYSSSACGEPNEFPSMSVHPCGKICIQECYFEDEALKRPVEDLMIRIKNLPDVEHVELRNVQL